MRVWLEVPDARAAADELGSSARAAADQPGIEPFEVVTGWTAEVADPWGYVIGLTDHTEQPPPARRAEGGKESY
ncbi:VOC family protein [Nonomuraea jabiensis]|uniref:VOC family protein n=1 Tax=Nonomuraea jabiensis TaxID=882448 RepID=UPI0036C0EDF0